MSPEKCAPKTNSKLPEKHFREIPNPLVQGLHIACVEVFTTSIKPADFVKVSLDIVLMNGRKGVALQPMVLHAIGLLYSFLPVDEFITKLFDELVTMILTDPHLGEFSQAFNLTGCSSSQFSSNNESINETFFQDGGGLFRTWRICHFVGGVGIPENKRSEDSE
ncbi:12658_t:CDS:2 [Entrophospora sp. SA101]|nr:12658_t:CDS:2 [Entrophospora sp. SA101]